MAVTRTRKPPAVLSAYIPDPEGKIDIEFADGTLQVCFTGHPEAPGHVLVQTIPYCSADRSVPVFYAHGVAYSVAVRLRRDGSVPGGWRLATSEFQYDRIRRVDSYGIGTQPPTDAGRDAIILAAKEAATTAVDLMPWGWDAATVTFLELLAGSEQKAATKLANDAADAQAKADATAQKLIRARLALAAARETTTAV